MGDILEVRNNEQIPADLIILASALPQNSAYIETANIDGESNLKLKIAAGVGGQSLAGSSSGSDDYQRKAQLFKRSDTALGQGCRRACIECPCAVAAWAV